LLAIGLVASAAPLPAGLFQMKCAARHPYGCRLAQMVWHDQPAV